MKLVGMYYQECRMICFDKYSGNEWEDYFHDTCILVGSEKTVPVDKKSFIKYFAYRYNMVVYQMKHDEQERKEVNYADNIQVAEEEEGLL